MRQLYSSPRLENVEAVAQMMGDAGIETWISGSRSYKGKRRSRFSYRDAVQEPPAVWLIKPGDLGEANELLRQAGLLKPSTRDSSYVNMAGRLHAPRTGAGKIVATRLRLVLIIATLGLAMLSLSRMVPGG